MLMIAISLYFSRLDRNAKAQPTFSFKKKLSHSSDFFVLTIFTVTIIKNLSSIQMVSFSNDNLKIQMYNLTKLKILVIGPEASGKTAVVNYLSQKSNVLDAPYRPTNSVRIVEHQTQIDNRLVSVEFWDVSGNIKNQRVWPGIQKEAQGVIVVFNGDNPKSQAEADNWVQKFPKALNIPISQCVAFSQHFSGTTRDKKPTTLKAAPNMKVCNTCIQEGSSTIYPAFDSFLNALIDSLIEKQQKEQQNLMMEQ